MRSWSNNPFHFFYNPYYDYQGFLPYGFYHRPLPIESFPLPQIKQQQVDHLENSLQRPTRPHKNEITQGKMAQKSQKSSKEQHLEKQFQNLDVDQEYYERKQTPQRNTLSNTIKYFLRFILLRPDEAIPEIESLCHEHQLECSTQQFLQIFKIYFESKMNYISKECIESIWLKRQNFLKQTNIELKKEFCTIFRNLFIKYYDKLIFSERLENKKKKKKYETIQKKYIKGFIRELQTKYKRNNKKMIQEFKEL